MPTLQCLRLLGSVQPQLLCLLLWVLLLLQLRVWYTRDDFGAALLDFLLGAGAHEQVRPARLAEVGGKRRPGRHGVAIHQHEELVPAQFHFAPVVGEVKPEHMVAGIFQQRAQRVVMFVDSAEIRSGNPLRLEQRGAAQLAHQLLRMLRADGGLRIGARAHGADPDGARPHHHQLELDATRRLDGIAQHRRSDAIRRCAGTNRAGEEGEEIALRRADAACCASGRW